MTYTNMTPKQTETGRVNIGSKTKLNFRKNKVLPKKDGQSKVAGKKRYSMKVVTEVGSLEHIEWGWSSYERRKNRRMVDQLWGGTVAVFSLIQLSFTAYFAAFDPYNARLLTFLYILDVFDLGDICWKRKLVFGGISAFRGSYWILSVFYPPTLQFKVPSKRSSYLLWVTIGAIACALAIKLLRLVRSFSMQALTLALLLLGAYLDSLELEVGAPFVLIRGLYFAALTWIMMHLGACIWYLIPCSMWSDLRDGINMCWAPSWIYSGLLTTDDQIKISDYYTEYGPKVPSPNVNLYAKFLDHGYGQQPMFEAEWIRVNASMGQKYYYALYWSITTVTSVGLGEIHAITQTEMIFVIVAQFSTLIMLFGMFQGGIASMLTNVDRLIFEYKNRITAIVHYLRDQNQSTELVRNVTSFYKYLWRRSKGIEVLSIYHELPLALRSDIGLEICKQIIEKSSLFQDLSPGFLRLLSQKLRPMLALPEQVVMQKGEVSDLMVYIQHGELEVLSDGDTEVPVLLLKAGKLFGEVNLITKLAKKNSVRSIGHCDLIVLKTEDLIECLETYPDVADELRVRAEERAGVMEITKTEQKGAPAVNNAEAAKRRKQQKDLAAKMDDLRSEMGINLRPLMTALNIDRPQETLRVSDSMELFKIRDPMDEMVEYNMGSLARRVASRFRRVKQFLIDLSIDPDGLFYYVWERFVVAAVIITFFLNTYVGFFMSYEAIMASPAGIGYVVLVFSYLMDVFFLMDFGLKFVLQIVTANGKILDHKQMALSYIRSWGCYTDFLAVLPIEIFSLVALNSKPPAYSTWTLLGFLKLNRALRILNMPRFFDHLSANLDTSIAQVRIVKFFTYIGMLSQLSAVILFLVACNPITCSADYRTSWTAPSPVLLSSSSLPDYKYTSSLYFAVSLSTATGYGDVFPRSVSEQFVANLVMIAGMLLYGYCLASMTATLVNEEAPKMEFQDRLFSMVAYLESNRLSATHVKRAADSLALLWKVSDGEDIPGVKHMMIDMPPVLTEDIQVDDLIHLVSNVPLFRNIEDRVLRIFAPTVSRYLFPPGEFVIQGGDLIEELFVIRRGVCHMYHPDQPTTVISVLYPSMYFGEVGFLFNRHEIVTVRAITYCEVLAISRPKFDIIVQDVHWLQLQMDQISESRKYYENIIRAAKNAKPFVQNRNHSSPTRAAERMKKRSELQEDFQTVKTSIVGRYFYKFLMERTIRMDGKFIHIWEYVRASVAGLVFCLVLLQVGFQLDSFSFFGTLYAFDIYAAVDIFVRMHLQYTNDMHIVVSHPYKTAQRYLRSSFLIDLTAVIPFEAFLMCAPSAFSQDELLHWAMYFRLNRLLQIYRIPMLFSYLEQDIQSVVPGVRWLKYLLYFILFGMLLTCLPFVFECPPQSCALTKAGCHFLPPPPPPSDSAVALDVVKDYSDWIDNLTIPYLLPQYLHNDDVSLRARRGIPDYVAPVKDSAGMVNLDNSTGCIFTSFMAFQWTSTPELFNLIIPSWYWAITTATSTGFGDLFSHNQMEQVTFLFAMIAGNILCSYIIASIAAEQTNKSSKRAKFVNKMTAIQQYMHQERLPPYLITRIHRYYNFFWQRTKGDTPSRIIEGLSPSLTSELSVQLYKKVIDQVGVLKSTPPNFKKMLASLLKPLYIMEGEFVIRGGDISMELYFLFRGSVEISDKKAASPLILRSGRMLGDLSFLSGQKAKDSVRARENTDLFYVTRDDFETIFDHFPEVRGTMLQDAQDCNKSRDVERTIDPAAARTALPPLDLLNSEPEENSVVGEAFGKLWNRTIRPDGKFCRYFGYIMASVRTLSVILILYHCGFGDLRLGLLIFEYLLEIFVLLDFFVQRRTGFFDEYGNMILDKGVILEKFWRHRTGFWLYVMSVIPYELGVFAAPSSLKIWIFAFPRLLRAIPRLIRLHIFFQKWMLELDVSILVVRLAYSLTRLVLLSHFFTVIAYILAAPLGKMQPTTWIADTLLVDPSSSPAQQYITSLYWIVNTITFTGYGDIVAQSVNGRMFSSFVQIFGKAMYALIVGDIASTISNREIWRQKFENRCQALKSWLADQRIKKTTAERVQSYCCYLWNTNRGVTDLHTLLTDIPYSMRADIAFAVHSGEIREVVLFNKVSDALVRLLSACLRQVQYVPGDYVIAQGEIVREMYFLHRGEAVEVEAGVEIGVIRHGRHINWQTMIVDWPASRTVRATDNCEIYVLTRDDFDIVKESYLFELAEACEAMVEKLTAFLLEPAGKINQPVGGMENPASEQVARRLAEQQAADSSSSEEDL